MYNICVQLSCQDAYLSMISGTCSDVVHENVAAPKHSIQALHIMHNMASVLHKCRTIVNRPDSELDSSPPVYDDHSICTLYIVQHAMLALFAKQLGELFALVSVVLAVNRTSQVNCCAH